MAKKVRLYSTQHPTEGQLFDAEHAERMLAKTNGGWFDEPLKKKNVSNAAGNKGKDKKAEE